MNSGYQSVFSDFLNGPGNEGNFEHSGHTFLASISHWCKKEYLNKYVVNKDLQTMARMELHHVRRLFEFHEPSILIQLAETK